MDKKSVAKILKEIGIILDLKGDNPFKTRAYHNGARIIESLTENLQDLVESGEIDILNSVTSKSMNWLSKSSLKSESIFNQKPKPRAIHVGFEGNPNWREKSFQHLSKSY